MRILLDTHTLLWFVDASPNLSNQARVWIDDPANQKVVSIVSLWEIAIKHSLGRLALSLPLDQYIATHLTPSKVELLPIEILHLLTFAQMPWHHRDPFDRILVAQALTENIPIISADAALDAYAVPRLWN
jgi:PIN domain nuclease of toxin-antitoxin system